MDNNQLLSYHMVLISSILSLKFKKDSKSTKISKLLLNTLINRKLNQRRS